MNPSKFQKRLEYFKMQKAITEEVLLPLALPKTRASIEKIILEYEKLIKLYEDEHYLFLLNILIQTIKVDFNNSAIVKVQVHDFFKQNIDKLNTISQSLQNFAKYDWTIREQKDWFSIAEGIGNLSIFLIEFPMGDRSKNIETCITAYKIILNFFESDSKYKVSWAMTQNNIANAYFLRIQGDKKDNIELAIEALKKAVKVNVDREPFGNFLHNLGNAYQERIVGDKRKNLEAAQRILEQALTIRTKELYPHDWVMTKNSLGLAYFNYYQSNYLIDEDAHKQLNLAIDTFQEVFSIKFNPEIEANVLVNLSNALMRRSGDKFLASNLDDAKKDLKLSIKSINTALNYFTKESYPYFWAMSQNILGNIYYLDYRISEKESNLINAISCYESVLTICTPQSDPYNCLIASKNLGMLHFREEHWALAIEAFSTGIEAIEISRSWSVNDNRRQKIITQFIEFYENIVQAFVNNGQIEKAIEYAERSRCRRLVDLMASNDLYSDGNIPLRVAELLKKYDSLQQDIDNERKRLSNDSDSSIKRSEFITNNGFCPLTIDKYKALSDRIEQLESKKQKVWQEIRKLDIVLSEQIQVEFIPFDAICQLIPDSQSAIIYFYASQFDLKVFVIFKNKSTKLYTSNFDRQQLASFGLSWFQSYFDWAEYERQKSKSTVDIQSSDNQGSEAWKEDMSQVLARLSKHLSLDEIVENCLQNIEELIIVPHLYLHSIPFSALPINSDSQELLSERFRLRILPSAQVLQFCHERNFEYTSAKSYGTIENADNTLAFSQYEGEKIADIFDIPRVNRLQGTTQATVENYRKLVKNVQGLHSSHHATFRIDNPLESRLILAEGKSIDLGSIMSPGWRLPNLEDVFLSCCETSLGNSEELSDDPLTLATGFLCAGARSVVSTLWKVDDLATAIFSIIYYQLRKDGLDRPTALQQAQHQLRNITREELKQRFYSDIDDYNEAAYKNFKQCKRKLKKLAEDTSEYQQIYLEQERWRDINYSLSKSKELLKKFLEERCEKSLPFAHPYYWAGFICQGLR